MYMSNKRGKKYSDLKHDGAFQKKCVYQHKAEFTHTTTNIYVFNLLNRKILSNCMLNSSRELNSKLSFSLKKKLNEWY